MAKGYITLPVGYQRVDNLPLLNDQVFATLAAAQEYVAGTSALGSIAYAGQILAVTEGDTPTVYVVKPDKSLSPIAGGESAAKVYTINLASLTTGQTSENIATAIGTWENFVEAVNSRTPIIGYNGDNWMMASYVDYQESPLAAVTMYFFGYEAGVKMWGYSIINTDGTLAVDSASVNQIARTTDLPTKVSDLENDSDFQTATEVTEAINSAIAARGAAYTPKGSKTVAELLELTGVKIGDVYNITDGGEIEDGLTVRPGDNVAALKAGAGNQADMWDVLSGTVDLSDYVTTSQLSTQINTRVPTTRTVNSKALSDNIVLGGADITVGGSGDYAESTVQEAIDVISEALAGAIAGSVSSFGGQTGAITVDTVNNTAGQVKFAMSGKNLTGSVNGWATKVDTTRTINSKPLSANVVLAGGDIQCGSTTPNFEDVTIAAALDMITQTLIPGVSAWATWE